MVSRLISIFRAIRNRLVPSPAQMVMQSVPGTALPHYCQIVRPASRISLGSFSKSRRLTVTKGFGHARVFHSIASAA